MLLSCAVLFASLLPGPVDAVPRAVVTEAERDLGLRAPGEPAEAHFTVRNDGEAPLEVRPGRVTGGLADVDVEPANVAPGTSARVRVVVDTWSVEGPSTLTVPLATNDPAQPRVALAVRLDVQVAVVAHPGYARYVFVQTAGPGAVPQRLRALDGQPFRVLAVESPYAHLLATSSGTVAAPEQDVVLTLQPEAPVGPLGAEVVVRLDHPRQKEVRIPVSGFVRPVFAATPPAVSAGEVRPGHATHVSVRSFLDTPFRLGPVDADVPGVDVAVDEVVTGESWTLTVTVREDAPPGPIAGTVRIRTTSPARPFVEVPYAARVVRP